MLESPTVYEVMMSSRVWHPLIGELSGAWVFFKDRVGSSSRRTRLAMLMADWLERVSGVVAQLLCDCVSVYRGSPSDDTLGVVCRGALFVLSMSEKISHAPPGLRRSVSVNLPVSPGPAP